MRQSTPVPRTRAALAAHFTTRSSRFEQLGKVRMRNVFARIAAELLAGTMSPARAMREAAVEIEYAGCSLPPEERRV